MQKAKEARTVGILIGTLGAGKPIHFMSRIDPISSDLCSRLYEDNRETEENHEASREEGVCLPFTNLNKGRICKGVSRKGSDRGRICKGVSRQGSDMQGCVQTGVRYARVCPDRSDMQGCVQTGVRYARVCPDRGWICKGVSRQGSDMQGCVQTGVGYARVCPDRGRICKGVSRQGSDMQRCVGYARVCPDRGQICKGVSVRGYDMQGPIRARVAYARAHPGKGLLYSCC